MVLQRFYADSIAQASFLIGCAKTGEAIVVDPNRDLDPYLDVAKKQGLRITAVTETHIHADYVSGSRELASLTGAKLYLSREGGQDWQYLYSNQPNVVLIGDGDEIEIGNVRLQAIHTPGHTPEHLSFQVTDGAATDQPLGVLTGDFIFAGDVGRPDLLQVAAGVQDTMREGARSLFNSISQFKMRPDWLTLWPGHGAGSACGKSLGAIPSTTLGYEKLVNPALRFSQESDFIADILSGQPEPPKYFARMKQVNREGPSFTYGKWRIAEIEPTGQLLDVRRMPEILAGSSQGAIAIPPMSSFTKWAGSLLDLETPITILANEEKQAIEAAKTLVMIGIENVAGWSKPTAEMKLPTTKTDFGSGTLLDVRGSAEREEDGFIPGSLHIPLTFLADHGPLPEGRIYVHCASGSRSVVGASFLRSQGIDSVAVMASLEELKAAL